MKQIEDPTVTLPAGYCQLISNYYKKDGVWFLRSGATKLNTGGALDGSVSSIREVVWDDGHKELIVSAGTKWYKTFDFTVNTVIKQYFPSASPIDITQFKISNAGQAILANKFITPQKYDNITLSNLSTGLPSTSGVFNTFTNLGTPTIRSIVKDSTSTYMYAVANTVDNEISVYKIRLADNSIVATITTGITAGTVCLAIDSTDTNLYVLSDAIPSVVSKIRLSDFTYVTKKTLAAGESGAQRMAIDSTNAYLYIITGAAVGYTSKVVKLTLADFTTTSTLDLAQTTNTAVDIVVNATHAYVLFTTTPKVLRVLLSDFSTVATKTLAAGATSRLLLDSTYLYVSTQTSPGLVYKITLSDFSTTVTATLPVNNAWGMLIIGTDLFIGTDVSIARIDLNNYATIATYTTTAENYYDLLNIGSGIFYASANAGISKVNIYASPKFVVTHKSKVWVFGFEGNQYRLYGYYSKTLDATDFVTANDAGALTFGTEFSKYDTPIGHASWGDYIIFLFANDVLIYYAGTNPNDFKLVKHLQNVGSLTRHVLNVGADVWIPTISGIRSLQLAYTNGEIVFNSKSQDVDLFWTSKITAYGTNTDRICMKYDKIRNQIMILTNDSANQGICFYVYSVSDKCWSTYNVLGLGANVSITAFEITQDGLIYFGTSDGNIYQLFSGATDNGTAISYVIRPTTQYFNNSVDNKKVKYIQFGTDAAITAGSISYDVDQKGIPRSTTAVVKASSGSKGMLYSPMIPVQGRGKSWDFQFTNCGLIREILFFGDVEGQK